MCVYTYIYIYMCIHTCMDVCVYRYRYIYIYTYIYIYICVCIVCLPDVPEPDRTPLKIIGNKKSVFNGFLENKVLEKSGETFV